MMKKLIKPAQILMMALILALPIGGGVSDVQAQSCLSNSQANAVVSSGQAKSLAQVKRQALRGGGKIVGAKLCRRGNGYVYVISVKVNNMVKNVTVNAS